MQLYMVPTPPVQLDRTGKELEPAGTSHSKTGVHLEGQQEPGVSGAAAPEPWHLPSSACSSPEQHWSDLTVQELEMRASLWSLSQAVCLSGGTGKLAPVGLVSLHKHHQCTALPTGTPVTSSSGWAGARRASTPAWQVPSGSHRVLLRVTAKGTAQTGACVYSGHCHQGMGHSGGLVWCEQTAHFALSRAHP